MSATKEKKLSASSDILKDGAVVVNMKITFEPKDDKVFIVSLKENSVLLSRTSFFERDRAFNYFTKQLDFYKIPNKFLV